MARRLKALGAAVAASALLAASTTLAAPPSSEPGFSKKTAIEVNVGGTASVDSAASTNTVTRPVCGSDTGNSHAVWFTFTATSSQDLTADTVGSAYDTVLDVYRRGKFIDCNDDDFGGSSCGSTGRCSRVGFTATAGRTYYFRVAEFSFGPGGNTVLNLKTN
jgi:hypothetical protein